MDNDPQATGRPERAQRLRDAAEAMDNALGTPEYLSVDHAYQDMESMLEVTPPLDRNYEPIVSRITEHLGRMPKQARARFIATYWPGPPPSVDEDGMPVLTA